MDGLLKILREGVEGGCANCLSLGVSLFWGGVWAWWLCGVVG